MLKSMDQRERELPVGSKENYSMHFLHNSVFIGVMLGMGALG